MRFEATAEFTAAEVDADPAATPGVLNAKHVISLLRRQQDSDVLGKRILLVLDAPVAETVTLELWALDDQTEPSRTANQPDFTTRRWYRFATGIVVTGRQITEVTAACPDGGVVYARRTADALVGTRTLKATCVP